MPKAATWTEDMDAKIIEMRAEGLSWDHVSAFLGFARWTCIQRGKLIGATAPERLAEEVHSDERKPLPPGSLETWGSITAGSCLEGVSYPAPRHTGSPIVAAP